MHGHPFDLVFSVDKVECATTSMIHIDGLVQERRNSSALAMELRLSCANPSTWSKQVGEHSGLPSCSTHAITQVYLTNIWDSFRGDKSWTAVLLNPAVDIQCNAWWHFIVGHVFPHANRAIKCDAVIPAFNLKNDIQSPYSIFAINQSCSYTSRCTSWLGEDA